jgi:hypothetical protein
LLRREVAFLAGRGLVEAIPVRMRDHTRNVSLALVLCKVTDHTKLKACFRKVRMSKPDGGVRSGRRRTDGFLLPTVPSLANGAKGTAASREDAGKPPP